MLSIQLHDVLPLLGLWSIVVGMIGYTVGYSDGLGYQRPSAADRRTRERRPVES